MTAYGDYGDGGFTVFPSLQTIRSPYELQHTLFVLFLFYFFLFLHILAASKKKEKKKHMNPLTNNFPCQR